MSSTNKTTNYELSQFIGTDKPAWLTDYNSDMGKIDAGVATAQSTATGADGKATANATAIGDLTSLTTTAKTNLVAAVNEVKTSADTAANSAASAAGNANQALTKVNELADYFTMTVTQVPVANIVSSTGNVQDTPSVSIAKNSTNSLGKVYGEIHHYPTTSGWQTITLNIDSGIHPDAQFTISPAGVTNPTSINQNQKIENVYLRFNPSGTIDIRYWADATNVQYHVYLMPCLYFFTDFGDLPEE
jgi:hypothetical protein